MEYRQVSPPSDLAPWIECVWLLRGIIASQGQMILPDGRLELVFHLGATPVSSQRRQPAALIAGRMSQALELNSSDAIDTLGIRLRPQAAGRLVPSQLLAATESMDAVLGPWALRARERLGNSSETERIGLIWKLLRARINRDDPPDPIVTHSVRRIEAARGRGPVDPFIPDGIGPRQWQRRFIQASGFTPKAFARITRFQHLIGLCQSMSQHTRADLALEAGFYDQAHLANEFRAFTGQSLEAYFRAQRGMSEFYRDGFFQDEELRHN